MNKLIRTTVLTSLVTLASTLAPLAAPALDSEEGFKPIFDGHSSIEEVVKYT